MKIPILMICALMAFAYTCHAQKSQQPTYKLTVDVRNLRENPKKIYLLYFKKVAESFSACSDSALVKNGFAKFSGHIPEPCLALIQTKMFGNPIKFCLSDAVINIHVDETWDKFVVNGSKIQSDFESLIQEELLYNKRGQTFADLSNQAYKNKDTVSSKQYRTEFINVYQEMYNHVYKQYIISHALTSSLSTYALTRYSESGNSNTDSLYNLLAPSFKKLPSMVVLKKHLDQIHSTSIGMPAPLFTQPDSTGKEISLSSFRGKYVLVDFWASWCHPCRAESPFLIKAFDKFHPKNFEVLGVSLDDKKTKGSWLKAIHDDHVESWAQVSDLKGWNNSASTLYGIKAIPQNYLVDPDGKIIATNLRGEELEKKLSEILGQ